MVADGSFYDASSNEDADWFNAHIRLMTVITEVDKAPFSPETGTSDWTLCIVGGKDPLEESRSRSFLQVASWNGLTFRFYQVSPLSVAFEL